jgi:hypothetical protein
MSAESEEELIAEIVATLKVDAKRRDEVVKTVRSRLEAKRPLQRFYEERLPEGVQKQKASALSRALEKAKSLSREIEPLFSGISDELTNYDPSRSYTEYMRFLDHGIKVADELRTKIIVPRGKKRRDFSKFQAKALATKLVGEAGKRGEQETINLIASLMYEFLTGRKDADISEPPDAYEPPPIRTRRLTTKK